MLNFNSNDNDQDIKILPKLHYFLRSKPEMLIYVYISFSRLLKAY
jgi:hypothetical protein